jgi:hypothetical protein
LVWQKVAAKPMLRWRVSDGTRTRGRLDRNTAQWLFPGALG